VARVEAREQFESRQGGCDADRTDRRGGEDAPVAETHFAGAPRNILSPTTETWSSTLQRL
jgi:hypothetical protein